jgi:hypothetical protein
MSIKAVLTADIVNSTKLTSDKERKLRGALQDIFQHHKIEFFRGDSFQAYIRDPQLALKLALLSRAAAITLSRDNKNMKTDVRISIGIGTVESQVRTLQTARGEAFLLSGRNFDVISRSQQRLAIAASNPMAQLALQVIADYLNAIFAEMTGKQAEVILELLKGKTQKLAARKLKKTKSTIHQRVVSARWPEVEKLMAQFDEILKLLV